MTPSGANLDLAALTDALVQNGPYQSVHVVERTDSTNLRLLMAEGPPHLTALLAEYQTDGRGRAEVEPGKSILRRWEAAPGTSLLASVVVRPARPATLLTLMVGLSAVRAIDQFSPGLAGLKWPNDVMIGGHKVGGALVQVGPDGRVVIGLGINVTQSAAQLPHPSATSLRLEGLEVSLTELGIAWLDQLARSYTEWEADPARIVLPVKARMKTLGQRVKVTLPNGAQLNGVAEGLAINGELCLRTDSGELTVLEAGDVHHVRPDRISL